jgi:thiol-disulfide isomerase/thioredoxin
MSIDRLAAATAAFLIAAVATGCQKASDPSGLDPLSSGRGVTIQWSDRPVDLPALQLIDLDGVPISNESLRGRVVLLNFWATWCGPCREEIPMLVALQSHYRDRLTVVGVSIDDRPVDEVKAAAAGFKINYPVVMSTRDLERALGGISAVPATFVVNPEGKIVQRHVGLLQERRTEHEVRALAGLFTEAAIETVKDTGQVLLSNAAYATTIPGVDLDPLGPAEKRAVLEQLNTEHCTCGCSLTIAQCRINDPACPVSLPIAQAMAKKR